MSFVAKSGGGGPKVVGFDYGQQRSLEKNMPLEPQPVVVQYCKAKLRHSQSRTPST
jgi:hypothetical protein